MRFVHLLPVVLVILLAGCAKKDEPVIAHGKPVAHWLEELKKPDAKARKKATGALGLVGKADPAAIPALIRALKDSDATVRHRGLGFAQHWSRCQGGGSRSNGIKHRPGRDRAISRRKGRGATSGKLARIIHLF